MLLGNLPGGFSVTSAEMISEQIQRGFWILGLPLSMSLMIISERVWISLSKTEQATSCQCAGLVVKRLP